MSDFPEAGDNFRLRGPWRILSGNTWSEWRSAAIEAEIAAAEASGDLLTLRRLRVERRKIRLAELDG